MKKIATFSRWISVCSFASTLTCALAAVHRSDIQPPGHDPQPLGYHAFTETTVVASPSLTITNATLLIAEGKIVSVSEGGEVPAGSRVRNMKGYTIYPGLIDPYYVVSPDGSPVRSTGMAAMDEHDHHHGHRAAGDWNFFGMTGDEQDPGSKGPGSALSTVTPEYSVLDNWRFESGQRKELRNLGFTAVHLSPSKGIFRGTGAVSLTGEASPNELIQRTDTFQHLGFNSRASKSDEYPRSLMGAISAIRQTLIDTQDYTRLPQSDRQKYYNPSLEALTPALHGNQSVLIEPGSVLMASRAAKLADEFGLRFNLIAAGQEWRRPDLLASINASFIVPINFPEIPSLPEEADWDEVDLDLLRHWDWAPEVPSVLVSRGHRIALTLYTLHDRKQFRKKLKQAIARGLSESTALAALTTIPAELCGLSESMGTLSQGKQANFTIVYGDSFFNPDHPIESTWVKGVRYANESFDPDAKKDPKEEKKDKQELEKDTRVARSPLEEFPTHEGPDTILIKNATLWTSSPMGVIEQGDMLIQHGHILEVGKNLSLPAGDLGHCLVIDATGKFVTPGLIDAHSHSMIMGGVNEGTYPSTAMVRIADVVNSETENIYYQLAGGLTIANLLHGSANPIGGQNAVIKLRWGKGPDDLIFKAAPGGIKFALGENVKQSNWGDDRTTRFPQSRMGVPVFYENRFTAAKHYQTAWQAFRDGDGMRPDRDLEMEALVEILEGRRWIHCHSYRQDEILMFLRVMESFGVRVGTLQHVLEGYKIADEIVAHGAGASCFTDWWAYKFEVIDAIPYAGSLMHERGALVSFNSDDSDLARRMYLEAAKAVKYGSTPPEEALNFVTRYPAQQLKIDHLVGSLEKGKHADFVIWSKPPLDSGTTCLETWIEGVKYFDRFTDSDRTTRRAREKAQLVEKAKQAANFKSSSNDVSSEDEEEWHTWQQFFQRALEKKDEGRIIHCDD